MRKTQDWSLRIKGLLANQLTFSPKGQPRTIGCSFTVINIQLPDFIRPCRRSDYFPIQKVENIKFKMSSDVVCPVSESSAHSPR